jgi:hypothetical protein
MNVFPNSPSAGWCFGRQELVEALPRTAFGEGAVLLYGGRQSGKSTLLLALEESMARVRVSAAKLGDVDVPVYLDLLRLGFDDGPKQLFARFARLARNACERQVDGFSSDGDLDACIHEVVDLETFLRALNAVASRCGSANCRFLFLVDEAKRMAEGRFPRGFQENLYALLYNMGQSGRLGMVLAGAQDLNAFCIDDTSPLGTRAARRYVTNLDQDAIVAMCARCATEVQVADEVLRLTGGHAGLSVRLLATVVGNSGLKLVEAARVVRGERQELFRLWAASLSDEALALVGPLRRQGLLATRQIVERLRDRGLSPLQGDRAQAELQYTGAAISSAAGLRRVNEMFWDYAAEVDLGTALPIKQASERMEPEMWEILRRVELALRDLVRARYEACWGIGGAEIKMKVHLGPEAWAKLDGRVEKTKRQYPLSPSWAGRQVMECLFLGELRTLIEHGAAWHLFKDVFADKGTLGRLFDHIVPVRNDQAHFGVVPAKELKRCELACDDLLVLIEQGRNPVRGLV